MTPLSTRKSRWVRSTRRALVAFVLVPAGSGLLAQEHAWIDSSIDSLLRDRVNSNRSSGIVLGIVEPGRAPKIFSATQPGVALDGNSVFEIGSVTKVFTTALLADMVQRGEVKLDDPISKYLPSSVRAPARGGATGTGSPHQADVEHSTADARGGAQRWQPGRSQGRTGPD